MNDRDETRDDVSARAEPAGDAARLPYEAPRITKKRSVARVTLLSGMGAVSMGVISVMN